MMLSEVLKRTGLTRKAVEYYVSQGLVVPQTMDNGYREFGEEDVTRLEKIAAYRKLGVSVSDIQRILEGNEKQTLQELCVRRTLAAQRERRKGELLEKLASGASLSQIEPELRALEAGEAIHDRLLEAFPGYFGRYFCLHFAQFLNDPIETDAQREAYETIVAWLDGLPPLELDDELAAFLCETTRDADTQQISGMIAEVRRAVDRPEQFISEHEETIRAYLAMRETQAYQASPAARLMEQMKTIQRENGYLDVFIPAMERLSLTYAIYRERLQKADEAFKRMLEKET